MNSFEFLNKDVSILKGIGNKTSSILKKKNINKISDILWDFPRETIDNITNSKIKELQIGKKHTINIIPKKYSFPRIRNLPFKVICEDETGEIDCVFFNSYEKYIRKILPINISVNITGIVNFYKKKYQIINPKVTNFNQTQTTIIESKYSLTEGLKQTNYNRIINNVLSKLPDLDEWLSENVLKKFNNVSWKESILKIHKSSNIGSYNSDYYRRLAYDEILATFLISSQVRKKINKVKKKIKQFNLKKYNDVISKLSYELTKDQINTLNEINKDIGSEYKMFRLLQGDVGSGKTIVALLSALNVVEAGYQVAFMAPTEILANQHFKLAKELLGKYLTIELITGQTKSQFKKKIQSRINNKKIDLVIGTHSLFQKKMIFNNLGLIIIDEQHKFGVKQRKALSDKGGSNCDVLLLSATPIPRTLMMTIYGDMNVSIISQKPKNRKEVITYSKSEKKMNEIISFANKQIKKKNQIFWVCPLIEDSKKIDHESAIKKYEFLKKIFKDDVDIIHGLIKEENREIILKKFLKNKIKILVSTTVIEVGIDFPNANLIIIENANKFGLSQLHQLRGRVGRGNDQSYCVLVFKNNLSENAKKRIKILKETTDGFKISNEDMKLRGYGDILGFKQSGIKNFKLADPILHEDLFELAQKEIIRIENSDKDLAKYKNLVKLFDQAEIINDLV